MTEAGEDKEAGRIEDTADLGLAVGSMVIDIHIDIMRYNRGRYTEVFCCWQMVFRYIQFVQVIQWLALSHPVIVCIQLELVESSMFLIPGPFLIKIKILNNL